MTPSEHTDWSGYEFSPQREDVAVRRAGSLLEQLHELALRAVPDWLGVAAKARELAELAELAEQMLRRSAP